MITIYGASDDLVEVEGCKGADEFNVYGKDGHVHWHGDLIAPDGAQMRVYAIYDGCWTIAPGMVDEDVPFPPWPLKHDQGAPLTEAARKGLASPGAPAHSVSLSIEAPEGTRLTNIWPAADSD